MRMVFLVLFSVIAGGAIDGAKADPYRWCAQYSGRGGGTNCGFVTWEQCRATVSGAGGFCSLNPWYDGRPIGSPPVIVRPKKPT